MLLLIILDSAPPAAGGGLSCHSQHEEAEENPGIDNGGTLVHEEAGKESGVDSEQQ